MTLEAWIVILLLALILALIATNRLRVELGALSIAAVLGLLQFAGMGILDAAHTPSGAVKAISGFGQPVVITLIGLFIITRCLEKSGITRWLTRYILLLGGKSEARLIGLFALATALLSLFMNNLAAGALLLPSALEACRRTGLKPSKLLIPVAYGSLLGGVATYFTTANIIVSDLLTIARPPQARLNVLDFTPTGGLIAIAGILFMALLGHRLLPDREPSHAFRGMRPTGSDLEDLYQLGERLWEGAVQPDSPHVDHKLSEAAFGEKLGLTVVAVLRNNHVTFSPSPDQVLHASDVLWIVGREDRVCQLEEQGLSISKSDNSGHISALGLRFVEVLLSPRSKAQGRTLKDLAFRSQYGLTAIALQRRQRTYRTNVADLPLEAGDSLLMAGDFSQLIRLRSDPDFIVLESSLSDQPVQPREAAISIGVVLAAVTASILGVPVYLAMLSGALLLILSGVLNPREAYESVEWQAVFLIAGMYTASLAMVQTGLAGFSGQLMVRLVTPLGPLGLAAGAYLLTALLTQVMGGQVTALVTGPIAISAAIDLHVSAQAIAVATAIGCSASFLTPLAHPVNILMIGPANYEFRDFFKVGWPMTLLSFFTLLAGMALFWKL